MTNQPEQSNSPEEMKKEKNHEVLVGNLCIIGMFAVGLYGWQKGWPKWEVIVLMSFSFLLIIQAYCFLWNLYIKSRARHGELKAQVANGIFEAETGHFEEAERFYRQAAEQGDVFAMLQLAELYRVGKGVAQDLDEAMVWWRKAAEKGNTSAMCNIGFVLFNGEKNMQDNAEAVAWWRKAAEGGNAAAMNNLGACFLVGQGTQQNTAEAIRWLRKGAEAGHKEAQRNLANALYRGEGGEQDEEQAVEWYRKAAEQNDGNSWFSLGQCYLEGRGVEKDEASAYYCYDRIIRNEEMVKTLSEEHVQTACENYARLQQNRKVRWTGTMRDASTVTLASLFLDVMFLIWEKDGHLYFSNLYMPASFCIGWSCFFATLTYLFLAITLCLRCHVLKKEKWLKKETGNYLWLLKFVTTTLGLAFFCWVFTHNDFG